MDKKIEKQRKTELSEKNLVVFLVDIEREMKMEIGTTYLALNVEEQNGTLYQVDMLVALIAVMIVMIEFFLYLAMQIV